MVSRPKCTSETRPSFHLNFLWSCSKRSIAGRGGYSGFCRKFFLEALCGMISLHDQRYNMRERDMAISFKGAHFPPEVILMGVRWYVAYPLSTRHVEELLEER